MDAELLGMFFAIFVVLSIPSLFGFLGAWVLSHEGRPIIGFVLGFFLGPHGVLAAAVLFYKIRRKRRRQGGGNPFRVEEPVLATLVDEEDNLN